MKIKRPTDYKDLDWTYKEKERARINELKYERKKRKELLKLFQRKYKESIHKIKSAHRAQSRLEKFTTTKIFMYIILFNCIAIEAYSMWVMYELKDLSALYSLIGAVVTQSVSFGIYCVKSHKDTKSEVDAQLERDKFEAEFELEVENNGETFRPDDQEDQSGGEANNNK